MKEKTVFGLKLGSHLLLFVISLTFTMLLFWQFGSNLLESILWTSFGCALEALKLYLLLLSKQNFRPKQIDSTLPPNKLKGVAEFGVYLAIAIVSAIATLAFALNTIENQSFSANLENISIEALEREYNGLIVDIDEHRKDKAEMPSNWITRKREVENLIELAQGRQREIEEELEVLSSLTKEVVVTDTFSLLAIQLQKWGVADKELTGRAVLFSLLMAMVVLLELTLALTSGSIKRTTKEGKNKGGVFDKEEFLLYVSTLLSNHENGYLKTSESMSKKLGIKLEKCKEYRELLLNTYFDKKPLIIKDKGRNKANLPKNEILRIMKIKLDFFSRIEINNIEQGA